MEIWDAEAGPTALHAEQPEGKVGHVFVFGEVDTAGRRVRLSYEDIMKELSHGRGTTSRLNMFWPVVLLT